MREFETYPNASGEEGGDDNGNPPSRYWREQAKPAEEDGTGRGKQK